MNIDLLRQQTGAQIGTVPTLDSLTKPKQQKAEDIVNPQPDKANRPDPQSPFPLNFEQQGQDPKQAYDKSMQYYQNEFGDVVKMTPAEANVVDKVTDASYIPINKEASQNYEIGQQAIMQHFQNNLDPANAIGIAKNVAQDIFNLYPLGREQTPEEKAQRDEVEVQLAAFGAKQMGVLWIIGFQSIDESLWGAPEATVKYAMKNCAPEYLKATENILGSGTVEEQIGSVVGSYVGYKAIMKGIGLAAETVSSIPRVKKAAEAATKFLKHNPKLTKSAQIALATTGGAVGHQIASNMPQAQEEVTAGITAISAAAAAMGARNPALATTLLVAGGTDYMAREFLDQQMENFKFSPGVIAEDFKVGAGYEILFMGLGGVAKGLGGVFGAVKKLTGIGESMAEIDRKVTPFGKVAGGLVGGWEARETYSESDMSAEAGVIGEVGATIAGATLGSILGRQLVRAGALAAHVTITPKGREQARELMRVRKTKIVDPLLESSPVEQAAEETRRLHKAGFSPANIAKVERDLQVHPEFQAMSPEQRHSTTKTVLAGRLDEARRRVKARWAKQTKGKGKQEPTTGQMVNEVEEELLANQAQKSNITEKAMQYSAKIPIAQNLGELSSSLKTQIGSDPNATEATKQTARKLLQTLKGDIEARQGGNRGLIKQKEKEKARRELIIAKHEAQKKILDEKYALQLSKVEGQNLEIIAKHKQAIADIEAANAEKLAKFDSKNKAIEAANNAKIMQHKEKIKKLQADYEAKVRTARSPEVVEPTVDNVLEQRKQAVLDHDPEFKIEPETEMQAINTHFNRKEMVPRGREGPILDEYMEPTAVDDLFEGDTLSLKRWDVNLETTLENLRKSREHISRYKTIRAEAKYSTRRWLEGRGVEDAGEIAEQVAETVGDAKRDWILNSLDPSLDPVAKEEMLKSFMIANNSRRTNAAIKKYLLDNPSKYERLPGSRSENNRRINRFLDGEDNAFELQELTEVTFPHFGRYDEMVSVPIKNAFGHDVTSSYFIDNPMPLKVIKSGLGKLPKIMQDSKEKVQAIDAMRAYTFKSVQNHELQDQANKFFKEVIDKGWAQYDATVRPMIAKVRGPQLMEPKVMKAKGEVAEPKLPKKPKMPAEPRLRELKTEGPTLKKLPAEPKLKDLPERPQMAPLKLPPEISLDPKYGTDIQVDGEDATAMLEALARIGRQAQKSGDSLKERGANLLAEKIKKRIDDVLTPAQKENLQLYGAEIEALEKKIIIDGNIMDTFQRNSYKQVEGQPLSNMPEREQYFTGLFPYNVARMLHIDGQPHRDIASNTFEVLWKENLERFWRGAGRPRAGQWNNPEVAKDSVVRSAGKLSSLLDSVDGKTKELKVREWIKQGYSLGQKGYDYLEINKATHNFGWGGPRERAILDWGMTGASTLSRSKFAPVIEDWLTDED